MAKQLTLILLVFLCTTLFMHTFSDAQVRHPEISRPPQPSVRLKATLSGHLKTIERIAFSPDGKVVATASEDLTVRIWDLEDGNLKAILSGEDKAKWELERWYYNWTYIKAHDFPKEFVGRLKETLDNGASRLAISPDRKLIITTRTKNPDAFRRREVMELWDIATGALKLAFAEIPYGITDLSWSPNGEYIIVEGSGRTKTRQMDVLTGRVKATLPYETCTGDSWFGDSDCAPFIFNADGTLFAKAKHPIQLWDSSTGQLVTELKSAWPPAQFSPTDKTLLVTRSKDRRTALVFRFVDPH